MPLLPLLIIALIQGVSEFLPISSHGHIRLTMILSGWNDPGVALDIAVHVGTLIAVMAYFWRDMADMAAGVYQLFRGKVTPAAKLLGLVILATLPIIPAGYYVNQYTGGALYTLEVIGWATLGFGILLYIIDRSTMTVRKVEHMTWAGALFVGLMQCLALIPGTSRSGITMTAARALGFERTDAARFAMLMSIPAILGAGTLQGLALYDAGNVTLTRDLLIAGGAAMVIALIAIALLMAWLKRAGFLPFSIYRVILGGALLYYAYGLAPAP